MLIHAIVQILLFNLVAFYFLICLLLSLQYRKCKEIKVQREALLVLKTSLAAVKRTQKMSATVPWRITLCRNVSKLIHSREQWHSWQEKMDKVT